MAQSAVAGAVALAVAFLAVGQALAIQVGEARGHNRVADALLATRVRTALLEHVGEDAIGIDVDALGGQVWLRGDVERRATEELAEEVARATPGVRRVVNRISVNPAKFGPSTPLARGVENAELEVSDGLLELKVKARLLEHVGLAAFSVEVEATDGVVSLSGKVPDPVRRTLILDVARNTRGVQRVIDLLRIAS